MNDTIVKVEHNDPLTDDVPISKEGLNYKTILVIDNQEEVFLFRMYELTHSYKKEMNYPLYVDYELGDIYMFPKYRGKKLSKILLKIFYNFVESGDSVILWVLGNNTPAIKLYKSLGFKKLAKNVAREDKMRDEYKWIKDSDEIIFFVKHII